MEGEGMMEGKLRSLKMDPVLFSRAVLGFNPFPFQEEILRDLSKRIVACMGRQTGKSTTIAAKALWFATVKAKSTAVIVSATLRQSMLMMDKVLAFIEGSPVLRRSVTYRMRTRLRFSNGSWIIALPCGRYGYTLRGHSANLVILDEAAFIPEEVIANVVLPMVSTTDGAVWMLSTPWDRDGIFYRAFTSPEWSAYHLPSSVNPLIKPQFLEEQRRFIGEERYLMEYEAVFIDDGRSYFPMTLLRPVIGEVEVTSTSTSGSGGRCFAGYDPGGKESYAAAVFISKLDDALSIRQIWQERGLTYTEATVKVAEMSRGLRVEKLCLDQTGLGQPIVEHAEELGLNVEGVVLTDKRREELLSNLKILLERRELILPNSVDLLDALNCVEYERTRSGGFKFTHRRGTYDDLCYALALACWAARETGGGGVMVKI